MVNVIITVSAQTDVSSVGKKGYVLGADEDWDYFYSGKKGLTIPALGGSALTYMLPAPSTFIMKWMRDLPESVAPCLSGCGPAGPASTW